MNLPAQIAKNLKDLTFEGNWTAVNLKESLAGVTWEQAITQVHSLNTIAALVFHTNFYIAIATKVIHGQPLGPTDNDKHSFAHPPIESQVDWDNLVNKTYTDVTQFVTLIEQLPEDKLWEIFVDEKYGNYYRNLTGIIEHYHYHLGQIVIIKKILQQTPQAIG